MDVPIGCRISDACRAVVSVAGLSATRRTVGSVAIAGALAACAAAHGPQSPEGAAGTPTARPTSSTPSPAAVTSTSQPGQHPAACRADALTMSMDKSRTGPTNGTENVVLLLRNRSGSACWLGAVPTLSGVTAAGGVVRLGFHPSADPAYANPSPASGPGVLRPGRYGAVHVTLFLKPACTSKGAEYSKLRLQLGGSSTADMSYPSEMSLSGCLGDIAEAGPI